MKIYRHLTANALNLEEFDFQRELSMEAYLIENKKILALDKDLFTEVEIICDELSILKARKSKDTDGRIDLLVMYEESECLGLIELKKGEIGRENIEQLRDYLVERDQILKDKDVADACKDIKDPKWVGILAGTSISSELKKDIEDGFTIDIGDVKIPLAALTIKRYRSDDGQFFVVTDTYFNSLKASKDFKKYKFNGIEYNKSRLVLAIVQAYVGDHSDLLFADLKKIFPDSLQGGYGVFTLRSETSNKEKRYFCKDEEVIMLKDSVIAVSSQWGTNQQKTGNFDKFLSHALTLNFKID